MLESRREVSIPTDVEEEATQREIALDPDAPEMTMRIGPGPVPL